VSVRRVSVAFNAQARRGPRPRNPVESSPTVAMDVLATGSKCIEPLADRRVRRLDSATLRRHRASPAGFGFPGPLIGFGRQFWKVSDLWHTLMTETWGTRTVRRRG